MSLIPGIGWPVVTSSTMCANEVGYGAGGSLGFEEGDCSMPSAGSTLAEIELARTPFDTIDCCPWAVR
jgi:hypothetical protein